MSRGLAIRPFQDQDEAGILGLRRRVFGDLDPVRARPAVWRWQFLHNPAGRAVCAVAEDRERIVGQYAAIPTRFSVQGKEMRFALSCDTMIHPDYRRRGLFTLLARDVYRRLEEDKGITTVWGFPNEASLPGFTRRLDWRLLAVFPVRAAVMRPLTLLGATLGLKRIAGRIPVADNTGILGRISDVMSGFEVQSVRRFGREYDTLWHRRRDLAPIIQVRDADYLNWRYGAVPEFGYHAFSIREREELLGYMVIRCMSLMGHFFGVLTDLFPFPVKDLLTTRQLFRVARDWCRDQGAAFMTCLFSRATPSFLRAAGLRTVPALLNPRKWHFGARYGPNEVHLLGVPQNWHLTYGDTDIV